MYETKRDQARRKTSGQERSGSSQGKRVAPGWLQALSQPPPSHRRSTPRPATALIDAAGFPPFSARGFPEIPLSSGRVPTAYERALGKARVGLSHPLPTELV